MNYKQMFEFFKTQVMENAGYKHVEQLTDSDISWINSKMKEYEESFIIDNK